MIICMLTMFPISLTCNCFIFSLFTVVWKINWVNPIKVDYIPKYAVLHMLFMLLLPVSVMKIYWSATYRPYRKRWWWFVCVLTGDSQTRECILLLSSSWKFSKFWQNLTNPITQHDIFYRKESVQATLNLDFRIAYIHLYEFDNVQSLVGD